MPDPVAREDVQSFLQHHAAFKFLSQHVKRVAVDAARGNGAAVGGGSLSLTGSLRTSAKE